MLIQVLFLFVQIPRRLCILTIVAVLGAIPVAASADATLPTVVITSHNAPVTATTCVTTLYAYAEVVVNAMNRSTRPMQAIDVRYQFIDASGRIIASYNNEFTSDLASGDTDGYRYNISGAVPTNAKQMRCIVMGATFAGKEWKRGQIWPEKLPPLLSPSPNAAVTQ